VLDVLKAKMRIAQARMEEAERSATEATEASRKVWEEDTIEEEWMEWRLTGRGVPVVSDYKFLGVRLKSVKRARWSLRREEGMVKAKGAFWRAWGLGLDSAGWITARGAKTLWETLVRPVLEYGAEVDSERWEEAERLQIFAGRMCLGVGREVPNVVVMGELGWMPVQARREILRLRYWGKIVGEGKRNPGSLVHAVYREGRLRVEEGRAKSQREWCVETKRLLKEVGLEEYWESEEVGAREQNEWALLVKRMVFRREEAKWREGMWRGGKRGMALTTLERYARVKRTLRNDRVVSG
jgi:hypothetical protein